MQARDKHIGEKHGDIEILAPAAKAAQGYLYYYWCRCSCGNINRYRYDQVRRKGNCGLCEDARESGLTEVIKKNYVKD